MTRETKIGLLVGLAFIIVIGILLSDHLQSSTEPPRSVDMNMVANNVRTTVTPPGASNASIVVPAPVPQPQIVHQVPTQRDLQQPTPASEIVKIGPGSASQAPTQAPNPNVSMTSTPIQQAPAVAQVGNSQQMDNQTPLRASQPEAAGIDPNSAIAQIARANGQQLVGVTPTGTQSQTAGAAGAKEYIAEPGDNLSKIAAKFYGKSTKAGQDAITAANPSLMNDPNKVIYVGKPYRIPAMASASTVTQQPAIVAVQQTPAAPTAPAATVQQKPTTPARSPENWYTVKSGDTLTRIAREELGDASAVNAIVELNRDTIKDPGRLSPNMKIRLPGKSVAQAN